MGSKHHREKENSRVAVLPTGWYNKDICAITPERSRR